MRTSAQNERLRGVILKLIQQQHEDQKHRHDDWSLLGTMEKLHFGVHLNLVRTLLQDLIERGCIAAHQEKDRVRGQTSISEIEMRPRGRDILEGRVKDDAILVEVE